MSYTTIFTGNFTASAGPVAAGSTVAGLTDLSGNRGTVASNKLTVTPVNLGDEFWVGHLTAPGSDAELNSKGRVRLPANSPNTFNVGLTARVQQVSTSFLRRRCCFGQFCISSVNNPGVPYFGVGVVASSASIVDVTQEQTASWYDSTKAYDLELEVTGSSPATMTLRAIDVSTGNVVHSISGTTTDADMQSPGLSGLCHTQLFGQTGTGPTSYSAYTVALESAIPALVCKIAEGASVIGSNVINVVSTTGGVPASSGAPYTYTLHAVKNAVNWTPGPANRIDNTGAVSVAANGNGTNLPRFTHTVDPGEVWFYRILATDARTPTPATTVATFQTDERVKADYLIVQGVRAAAGTLPALKSEYTNALIYASVGNSFTRHLTDTNEFTASAKAYLEANGVGTVYEAVVGFPGSALGLDWGVSRPIFSPGGNGPTGGPFGAYGAAGNDINKNLLANMVDRLVAVSAAHPGVPVLISFYEFTNAARGNVAQSAISADWLDIVAACAAHGWKVVLDGPAWLTPTSGNGPANVEILQNGFITLSGLCDNTTSYPGDDTYLAFSFKDSLNTFYGTGTDNSGIHVTPASLTARGTIEAEQARRGVLAAQAATATPVFSPVAGSYTGTQSVTLTSATSGATIRYTLDGSAPTTTTGTVYAGAISVSATTTIKAIAYKAGLAASAVATATFTIQSPADTTPPTIAGKVLAANGVTLSVTTSENTTGTAGFTVRVAGSVRAASWTRTNATTLTATLTSPACLGQTVTLSYNAAEGNILDAAGNEVADFTNAAVTNDSTVPTPVVPLPAIVPDMPVLAGQLVTLTAGDGPLRLSFDLPLTAPYPSTVVLHLSPSSGNAATVTGVVVDAARRIVGAVLTDVPASGRYSLSFEVDGIMYPLGQPVVLKVEARL